MLSVDEVWKLIDARVCPLAPQITPLANSPDSFWALRSLPRRTNRPVISRRWTATPCRRIR